MKEEFIGKYTIKKVPRVALVIDDYITEAKRKNTVFGLGDADVTRVRKIIKEYEAKTGQKISFTAFLITCYARVAEMLKYPINTFKHGNKYYTFDDVDVQTNIEKELPGGIKKPLNYTFRKANEKTLKDINDEMQEAKTDPETDLTTQKKKTFNLVKMFPKFPRFIRRLYIRHMFANPILRKYRMGTVGLTAVGMKGLHGRGYGHAGSFITPHTVGIAVAGIEEKPAVVNGEIVIREMLSMTFALDHSVVDGGPAERFGTELLYMIEEGCIEEDWCFKSLESEN